MLDKEVVSDDSTSAGPIRSLLRKFDIPLEFLDFNFVEKYTKVKDIEKILKILRSGEEGFYPELEKFVENKLRELDPQNRLLRVSIPVTRTQNLEENERAEIMEDLSSWIQEMGSSGSGNARPPKQTSIFVEEEKPSATSQYPSSNYIPIRGEASVHSKEPFLRPKNPERIKSWEYDKWDKFDVEEELTRLDVKEMQRANWEKFHQPKIAAEERERVQSEMKNLDQIVGNVETQKETDKTVSSKVEQEKVKGQIPVSTPSFIQDITEESQEEKVVKIKPSVKPDTTARKQRRLRVMIEDVNVGF